MNADEFRAFTHLFTNEVRACLAESRRVVGAIAPGPGRELNTLRRLGNAPRKAAPKSRVGRARRRASWWRLMPARITSRRRLAAPRAVVAMERSRAAARSSMTLLP